MQALQDTLQAWEKKTRKLQEVQDWLKEAAAELIGVPSSDTRWFTFRNIEDARNKIVRELEELETLQEAALAEHLERVGPLHLNFEDGTSRVLAAKSATAGGRADLLPSDLLSVWRVASVFEGSVVLGDAPVKLEFGDKAQVATVKLTAKARKPKPVVGEEALQSLPINF